MKHIFFDCGSHMFQGFNQFASMYSITNEWECYSFEANPHTYNLSEPQRMNLLSRGFNLKHFNYGVSDKNSSIHVNCALAYDQDKSKAGTFTSQGSNILQNRPKTGWPHDFTYEDDSSEVETIDFSSFIKEHSTPEDFVLIKMDIEGSEFDVLDKIVKDNTLEYIDKIYVEFHKLFFLECIEDNSNLYEKKLEYYKDVFGSRLEMWH